jgi:hypothetical protein
MFTYSGEDLGEEFVVVPSGNVAMEIDEGDLAPVDTDRFLAFPQSQLRNWASGIIGIQRYRQKQSDDELLCRHLGEVVASEVFYRLVTCRYRWPVEPSVAWIQPIRPVRLRRFARTRPYEADAPEA